MNSSALAAIASRELRSLFLSPLAWAVLAVVQLITALIFLNALEDYAAIQARLALSENPPGVTEMVLAPVFATALFIMLMVAPLITMRLLSEERRAGTLTLLMSAPLSMAEIVLGKFLAACAFFALMTAMVALMPLSLIGAAYIDYGLLSAAILGTLLALAAFAAAGLYISSLSAQPAVAAVGGFGLLLLLWILDAIGQGEAAVGPFSWLSLHGHFKPMVSGLFNSADLAYFIIFIGLFLALTIRRLDAERLQRGE